MASSISLHLDIQNSLLQTLQQTQTVMNKFNDNLQNAGKLTKKVDDHYDDIKESQKKITASSKVWTKTLTSIKDITKSLAAPFTTIFSAAKIIDTTKAILKHNTIMTKLSFRMGEAGKTTGQLTAAMHQVAIETGISMNRASELIQHLRRLRVPTRDIAEMASTTQKFAEITGISGESAETLAGNLMRVGRLGVKATKDVMSSMVAVQRQVGLAENEMEALTDATIGFTQYLSQLGKTSSEIKEFNKGVIGLAGAFTKVGLEAKSAAEIMDRLLDPGRLEDNALLLAKIGVSMEDVISGSIDMGEVTSGMRDLGLEMREMSGPAAAALASSMGMSLKQLRAMGDLQEGLADGVGDINKQWKEAQSPQERLQKAMDRISGIFEKLATGPVLKIAELLAIGVEKLMEFASKIFGGEGKKGMLIVGIVAAIAGIMFMIKKLRSKFFGMNVETSKHLGKVTEEALITAHKKANIVAAKSTGTSEHLGRDTEEALVTAYKKANIVAAKSSEKTGRATEEALVTAYKKANIVAAKSSERTGKTTEKALVTAHKRANIIATKSSRISKHLGKTTEEALVTAHKRANIIATKSNRTSEHLGRATEEALVMAHKRANIIAAKSSERAGRGRAASLTERVQAGPGFAAQMGRADQMAVMAEKEMLPAVKKMTEHTANWMRDLAMGTKRMSLMTIMTEQNNKKIKERFNIAQQEEAIAVNNLKQQRTELMQQTEITQKRYDELKTTAKSTEQIWERNKLKKDLLTTANQMQKIENKIGKEAEYYNKLKENFLRKLSPEERFNMKEQLIAQAKQLKNQESQIDLRVADLGNQRELLSLQQKTLKRELERSEPLAKAEGATREQVEEYVRMTKQLREVNGLLEENTSEMGKQNNELDKTQRQHAEITRQISKVSVGKIEGGALKQSFWHRTLRMAQSAGNRVAAGFTNAGKVIRNSAKAFGEVIRQRMDPRNWGRALVKRFRNAGGAATIGSSITSLLGPIGVLAGILLASKPVQEALKKVMTTIKPFLETIGELLAPVVDAFLPLITELAKMLMPTLVKILGGAVYVIGTLVRVVGSLIQALVGFGIDVKSLFMSQGKRQEELTRSLSKLSQGELEELTGMRGVSAEKYVAGLSKSEAKEIYKHVKKAESKIYGFGMKMAEAGTGLIETGKQMFEGTYKHGEAGAAGVGEAAPTLLKATAAGKVDVIGPMKKQQSAVKNTSDNTEGIKNTNEEIEGNTANMAETLTKILNGEGFVGTIEKEKVRKEKITKDMIIHAKEVGEEFNFEF